MMINGLCLRCVTYRFWLENLRYSSLRLAGLVQIDKNMFMDPFQNQGKREQLQYEIDVKGGQIFCQDCCKQSRPHVHHLPVESPFQASKTFSSVLPQVFFVKQIFHTDVKQILKHSVPGFVSFTAEDGLPYLQVVY